MGSSWMGEVVDSSEGRVILKEVAAVFDMPTPTSNGGMSIGTSVLTLNSFTEGEWPVEKTEFWTSRVVNEADKIYEMYKRAISGFRAEKAGIIDINGQGIQRGSK
jgi:hypothetical protein